MKLLVIDIQKGISDDRLYNFKNFLNNVKLLIETARKNKIEVIYVQHDDGKRTGFSFGDEEFEIVDEIKPKKDEKTFVKTVCSCFFKYSIKSLFKG